MARESSKRKRQESASTSKLKRPTAAYHFFSKEEIVKFKEENPNCKITKEVRSAIHKQWEELPNDAKEVFNQQFQKSQKKYKRAKKKLERENGETKSIQSRLSLSKVVSINEKLTELQREAVREIGLGALLDLKCTKLKHQLCRWLIDRFDPVNMTLQVHGQTIHITPDDVKEVLGLENKGRVIEHKGEFLEKTEFEEMFDAQDNGIPLHHVGDRLLKCGSHGHEFKALYCMHMIGYFLYPATKNFVEKEMLHLVNDIANLGAYNWAKFVLDSLARGLHTYRERNRKYVCGCVFFLMVLFLERVNPRDELDPPHCLRPCIKHWTDDEVSRRLAKFSERGGYTQSDACVILNRNGAKTKHDVEGLSENSDSTYLKELDELKGEVKKINARLTEIETRQKLTSELVMETNQMVKQLMASRELSLSGDKKKTESTDVVGVEDKVEEVYKDNDNLEVIPTDTIQLSSPTSSSSPASSTIGLSLECAKNFMTDDASLHEYLFSKSKDKEEIVVNVKTSYITRGQMCDLLPDKFISNPILDCYIAILSKMARVMDPSMKNWYMPTVFSTRGVAF